MRHFATEKFKSFLLAGTFTAFVGYVNRLSDSVIIGHVIGEDALAGLNMVTPILSVVTFFAFAIALGTSTNYSIWLGRIDRRRARGFFMQGLWLAVLVGSALALAMLFGGDLYFAMLDGSEYVEMYGRQYLSWAWPIGLTECLMMLLAVFCCADGDIRLCSAVYGGVFAVNVLVSYSAVWLGMGASGCALGTVIAETLGILALCGHFFRKVNTFRPVRHFSLSDSYFVFRASFGDAAAFLCDAVLFFVLNKLVIAKFGSDMLPVAGVLVGAPFGLDGVWAGLGAGPILGLLAMAAAILLKRGRHGFPMLLPRQREAKVRMFSLELTEPEIVRVSKAVAEVLPESVAQRAALMVEEVFMTVRERNPTRRRLIGEVTLDLNDGILMTLRDDGVIFDITDADARISSLRTYLVASVMERHRDRINLVTAGFNRNVFRFA